MSHRHLLCSENVLPIHGLIRSAQRKFTAPKTASASKSTPLLTIPAVTPIATLAPKKAHVLLLFCGLRGVKYAFGQVDPPALRNRCGSWLYPGFLCFALVICLACLSSSADVVVAPVLLLRSFGPAQNCNSSSTSVVRPCGARLSRGLTPSISMRGGAFSARTLGT